MINYGLECVTCLGLAYIHIPYIYCLIISLCWLFVNWGSKRSLVFYKLFEYSMVNHVRFVSLSILGLLFIYLFSIFVRITNINWDKHTSLKMLQTSKGKEHQPVPVLKPGHWYPQSPKWKWFLFSSFICQVKLLKDPISSNFKFFNIFATNGSIAFCQFPKKKLGYIHFWKANPSKLLLTSYCNIFL